MPDVIAKRVADIEEDGTPGAFEYYASGANDPAGLLYNCPCGCGRQGVLRFRFPGGNRPSWEWNGDRDKPSLQPSVHDQPDGKTHWHGWLTDGVWRAC